jgi:hypothetical protein
MGVPPTGDEGSGVSVDCGQALSAVEPRNSCAQSLVLILIATKTTRLAITPPSGTRPHLASSEPVGFVPNAAGLAQEDLHLDPCAHTGSASGEAVARQWLLRSITPPRTSPRGRTRGLSLRDGTAQKARCGNDRDDRALPQFQLAQGRPARYPTGDSVCSPGCAPRALAIRASRASRITYRTRTRTKSALSALSASNGRVTVRSPPKE